MFQFTSLSIFHAHHTFLHTLLPKQDIFLVGGAIRDVLLGITDKPTDIDVTMSGDPHQIWETMHWDEHQKLSRFKTDKYGTMTIIDKHPIIQLGKKAISYEITPFRTEGGYDDLRHPDQITRSNDLISDSRRRDFTSNCLYRTSTHFDVSSVPPSLSPPINIDLTSPQVTLQLLKKHTTLYLTTEHTLILQDSATIAQLCAGGNIQAPVLGEIIAHAAHLHTGATPADISQLSILLDPHGGLQDLLAGKLRTVGSPDDRFTEDALRILRAIRFPNTLNQKTSLSLDYDKATWIAMQHHAHLVTHLAKERIHQELVKVFQANNPFGYICLLNELGLIETLFPALANCKGDIQPVRYHPFDTFDHTLLTLEACQRINRHYLVKLAMLYHDVGKPSQYAYLREQATKNTEEVDMSGYLHHTESGIPLAQHDFQKLGFSNKEIEEICRYIRRHHRPGEILASNPDQRTKKIRTLISEAGVKHVLNLIDLAIADRLGQFNPMQPPAIAELQQMKKTVKQLHRTEGRFTLSNLAIDGNVLMQELGISPGPQLGKLLKIAFERVLNDIKERNTKEKILIHLRSLENQ